MTDSLGKILLAVGGLIAVAGLLLLFFTASVYRLPGDTSFKKKTYLYFPITTMLLVSAVLTSCLTWSAVFSNKNSEFWCRKFTNRVQMEKIRL